MGEHFNIEEEDIHTIPVAIIITSAILMLDILLPLGYATGVMYVVALFYLSRVKNNKIILLFGAITSILTLLAFAVKVNWTATIDWNVFANRGISLITIWVMAILIARYRKIQELNIDAIKKSEERFSSLVGSATDAIITADEIGNILSWNFAAERIFGWKAEELLGKPLSTIMPEKFRELHKAGMHRYSTTHKARVIGKTVELEGQRKDGTHFPIELSLGTWRMGEKPYFCGIIRDITARKKLEYELEMANKDLELKVQQRTQELETKNKELEQFVYIASHDLQEPLRSVSNFSGLLKEHFKDQMGERAEQYHKFISDATGRMSDLIKGLLDYSRLGKNNGPVLVDCNRLVLDVQEDLSAVIDEKEAVLEVGDLPELKGYEMELRLLFQNLISNAIKFSKPSLPPEIYIAASRHNSHWQFSISDNGIGIDPKYHYKIFQIFQRLHTNDAYQGTGIGLAHCKKIVELHCGKIWVDARPGEGSTFYFTLKAL